MQTSVPGKDAELFIALPNGRIKCTACARLCEIPEGKIGLCGIRGVMNNKLRLFVYGRVIAGHIDPIEKKPVTHYIGIPSTDPIFQTLKEIRDKTKIHVEITDLIVQKVGDDLEAARKLCKFVYDELGPDTPIHFLRFHPDYEMMEFDNTPVETLEKHHAIPKQEGLKYAHPG